MWQVARRGDLTRPEVAVGFDVSVGSVRQLIRQADADDGVPGGQTGSEQNEVVVRSRKACRPEQENGILRRAAAYFAQSSLPNDVPVGR